MTQKFIRRPEVEELTGAKRSTLYYWIKQGTFPPPVKIGTRASAWLLSDIEAWIQNRAAQGGRNDA